MATKTRRFQAIGTQKKHEVFEILQQDHATVKDLLMRLEKASEQESEQLLEQIERELTNHTEIEQELIYPAFKDSAQNDKDRKMYYESLEQHATVETVLLKLRAAESPDAFFARAKVLRDLVEHHIDEEEGALFPRARKLIPFERLDEVAQKIKEMRSHAEAAAADVEMGGEESA